MSELFRPEILAHQGQRLHGEVLLLPRLSHGLLLGFLLLFSTATAWWLAVGSYARKETVNGWLEPPQGITRIYAVDSGIVARVMVAEGETVRVGQPLLLVDGERELADGAGLEQRLLEEFESQRALLEEQLAHRQRIYERRRQALNEQLLASDEEATLLAAQRQTLEHRHALAQERLGRQRELHERGFVPVADLDNAVHQELGLRHEHQALLREELQRQASAAQLAVELQLLPEEHANEVLELRARLSDLARNMAQLQGRRVHVVKAPRAGQVSNLQARVGDRVHAGAATPLLSLLPARSPLTAQLLVPVRAAGFVARGQALEIRYDAYPYQKFGLYPGEIVNVSATVLMPNELLNAPLRTEEPVYRVTASLGHATVRGHGQDWLLKPGMTLSADIRLGERSLLQWLLEPIYSLKGRL